MLKSGQIKKYSVIFYNLHLLTAENDLLLPYFDEVFVCMLIKRFKNIPSLSDAGLVIDGSKVPQNITGAFKYIFRSPGTL